MTTYTRWAAIAGRVILIAIVAWAILRAVGIELARLDLQELGRWRPDPYLLVLASVGLLAVYLAHALMWRRIVNDLTSVRPKPYATLRVYFLSNLARYVPGRIWQIAGMAYFARQAGLPAMGAAGAAALGQVMFLVTGAMFVTLVLPAWAGPVPALVATGAAGIGGVLIWLALTRHGDRLRERAGDRLRGSVREAIDLARRIRPRDALLWAAGYAATWFVLGTAFAAFVVAFVPDAALEARHLAGTMAASYLVGYAVIFAPGGIGVREAVMTVLLDQVMPTPAAVLVAVCSRLWFTIVELLPLATVLLLRPLATHRGGGDAS